MAQTRWHKPYEKRTVRKFYDPDHYYWDTKEFHAYKRMVLAIIREKGLIAMRAIKEELGECQIDAWTADAVEHLLGKEIEAVGVIWTRYQVMQAQPKRVMRIDGFKHNEYQRAKHKANKLFPTAAVGENYWV